MTRILLVLLVPVLLVACKGSGNEASANLKTIADSAGYALGVDLAGSLKREKMAAMNFGLVTVAVEEVLQDKTTLFPFQTAGMVMQQYAMMTQLGLGDTSNKPTFEVKMVDNKPQLTNAADSLGYAMGVNIGNRLKFSGMSDLNVEMMKTGIRQVLNGDSLAIKPENCVEVLNNFMRRGQDKVNENVEKTIKEGEEFLAKNGQRPEVKTTATGLQYEVLKDATGPKPTTQDVFVAHYRGTLLNGNEFDSSIGGEPLEMGVSEVIAGWIEGLQLMSKGSKYKFWVPYNLGYGRQGSPAIPGGSVLVFEIELLDFKKP